jgi:hypothetical protein
MKVAEIVEGYKQVWGRNKKGIVRRYRCTDGPKKGRVVAKPSTCTTATSQKKSTTMKKTRRSYSSRQALRRSLRMKHPTSMRIQSANKRNRIKPKRRRKSKK